MHTISKYCGSSSTIETSVFLLVFVFLMSAAADRSEAQTLRGTAPTITVSSAVVGSEPTPVVNTSSSLRYQSTAVISKFTVQTVCASQKFTLNVLATSIPANRGVAAPSVSLTNGAPPADFITSIPAGWKANADAVLQYTAAPLFSQGTGTDSHTVTYTQVAQ